MFATNLNIREDIFRLKNLSQKYIVYIFLDNLKFETRSEKSDAMRLINFTQKSYGIFYVSVLQLL